MTESEIEKSFNSSICSEFLKTLDTETLKLVEDIYAIAFREGLRQLESESLEVIRFYADPQSWNYPGNDFHDFQIAKEDISECAWSAKSGKLMRGRKAGKRAREFMKKHEVKP